jgi:hypothetical protein
MYPVKQELSLTDRFEIFESRQCFVERSILLNEPLLLSVYCESKAPFSMQVVLRENGQTEIKSPDLMRFILTDDADNDGASRAKMFSYRFLCEN